MDKILVSACLTGCQCKYNGGHNRSEAVMRFLEGKQAVPVCPEVLGGLPVPRVCAEIRKGQVINAQGISVDREFRLGAERALEIARQEQVTMAVLQPRSPSCGVGRIYDGSFSKVLIDGNGVFAQRLLEEGIPVISADELSE